MSGEFQAVETFDHYSSEEGTGLLRFRKDRVYPKKMLSDEEYAAFEKKGWVKPAPKIAKEQTGGTKDPKDPPKVSDEKKSGK